MSRLAITTRLEALASLYGVDPATIWKMTLPQFAEACVASEEKRARTQAHTLPAPPATEGICTVHDPDDVVPWRICGRPLPCKDHATPTLRLVPSP